MTIALDEITALGGSVPGRGEAVADASSAGEEAVQLFVQMRKFIRGGEVASKPVRAARVVERAVRLAGGYVRERAQLKVDDVPDVMIAVSEPLFMQVLVNLLRNAANASPVGGTVDVRARVVDAELVFSVCDDGPGVSTEIGSLTFESFASATPEGTGLGLAISAYVMQLLKGRLAYRREPGRGACFTAALPLPVQAAAPLASGSAGTA